MFNIFIDLFRVLVASFSRSGRKRLIAGGAFAALLLTVAFSVFTCWVSQPRYADILGGISEFAAWLLSGSIAAAMFYLIAVIAHDIMRAIRHKIELPKYFPYVCIFTVCLGGFDIYKNIEGASDRAREIGQKVEYKYTQTDLPYSDKIADLKIRKEEIYKPYYWKGKLYFAPYPVTRHKKERFQRDEKQIIELDKKIAYWEEKQQTAIDQADTFTDTGNQIAANKEQSAKQSLSAVSVAIYLLMLLLSLVFVALSDLLDENPVIELDPDVSKSTTQDLTQPGQARQMGFATGKSSGFQQIGFRRQSTQKSDPKSDPELGQNLVKEFEEIFEKFSQKIEEIEGQKTGAKSRGKRPSSHTHLHTQQTEVVLDHAHPNFTQKIQPESYRGIDPKEYRKFVRIAQAVLDQSGRYNKSEISRQWGFDRKKVNRYFKAAIEKGDLTK